MAAQAPGKQRKEAEAWIAKATADALHLLGWLRTALPLLPGSLPCSSCGTRQRRINGQGTLLVSCHSSGLAAPCAGLLHPQFFLLAHGAIIRAGLHALQLSIKLNMWHHDAGGTAQEIAGLAVKLYSHRHPLLSRCATDTLAGLCSASSSLPAPALVELLRVITQSDSAWEVKDQSALVSLIDLIESACMRYSSALPLM